MSACPTQHQRVVVDDFAIEKALEVLKIALFGERNDNTTVYAASGDTRYARQC